MYKILEKKKLNKTNYLFRIDAPEVAKKAKAGQFIIIRIKEEGERIPLTIADFDDDSVTIVVQAVGESTKEIAAMEEGDDVLDFMGPLGIPSEIKNYGTVVMIGGGLGIAPCYPIAKAMKKAGNTVISILGARSEDLLFWEEAFDKICDEMIICTDDGSAGQKGFVTDALNELKESRKVDRVVAIGPPIMMKFVVKTAGEIPCVVSLNPIMIDGMGMCGGCRVLVKEKVKFACVDGPEFMGQDINWDTLMNRNSAYKTEEHKCRLE